MTDATIKPYLARSAVLHGAVLLAFVYLLPRALTRAADKVYMIDFVGGTTLQSAGVEAPQAAAAEAAPPKIEQQTDPDSIAPKGKRSTALPRPSLLKGWADAKPLPTPSLGAPSADAKPGAAASAGIPGDAAGVATDLPNFPYPWYISQVRMMLWETWRKRMPASSGEGGAVFAILRNGAVTDLRMESSSGDPEFDLAGLASVQEAAPFPPLPSDFAEPFLKIHLTLKSEASWR